MQHRTCQNDVILGSCATPESISNFLFYAIILFLPSQLGKHFWPSWSYVQGLRVDYLSPTIYFTDLLIILLFVFWLASWIHADRLLNSKHEILNTKQIPIIKTQNTKPFGHLRIRISNLPFQEYFLGILCLSLFIGIGLSINPPAGLYGLLKLCEFIFFGWYTARVVSPTCEVARGTPRRCSLEVIVVLFSCGILFESFLATAQFIAQSSMGGIFYFFGERAMSQSTPGAAVAMLNGQLLLRPYGTFPHPNVLAGYLTVAMAIVIFNFQFSIFNQISNFKKIILSFSVLLGTIAMLLSMSRVAIVVWILILCFFVIKNLRIKNSFQISNLKLKIFLGIFLIIATIFSMSSLRYRYTDILGESFTERVRLANIAIDMINTHPIFGVGLFNFIPTIPAFYTPKNESLFTYLQPVHNIFLLVASETGLIGLSFVVWFLVKICKRFKISSSAHSTAGRQDLRFKNNKLYIAEILIHKSLFIILIVLGMFDHYFLTIQQGQLLLVFVLGLCFANISKNKKHGIIPKEHVIFLSPLH